MLFFRIYSIAQRRSEADPKTNAVQILIEGGLKSIKQISDNLFGDEIHFVKRLGIPLMPLIVVEQSGRLSSCLLKALELFEDGDDDYLVSSDEDGDASDASRSGKSETSSSSNDKGSDIASSGDDGSIIWVTEEKYKQSKKAVVAVTDSKIGEDQDKDSFEGNQSSKVGEEKDGSDGKQKYIINEKGEDGYEGNEIIISDTNCEDERKRSNGENSKDLERNQQNTYVVHDKAKNRESKHQELRGCIQKHFSSKKFTKQDRENVFAFLMKCCRKKTRQYVSNKEFIFQRKGKDGIYFHLSILFTMVLSVLHILGRRRPLQ